MAKDRIFIAMSTLGTGVDKEECSWWFGRGGDKKVAYGSDKWSYLLHSCVLREHDITEFRIIVLTAGIHGVTAHLWKGGKELPEGRNSQEGGRKDEEKSLTSSTVFCLLTSARVPPVNLAHCSLVSDGISVRNKQGQWGHGALQCNEASHQQADLLSCPHCCLCQHSQWCCLLFLSSDPCTPYGDHLALS